MLSEKSQYQKKMCCADSIYVTLVNNDSAGDKIRGCLELRGRRWWG